MPAYGKKILVFLTFVLGSHGEGTKEAAAFVAEKQLLLLLGGQHRKAKGECQSCSQPAEALLLLSSALALPITCQSEAGPHYRLLPRAEQKSFTGHTVGIFVDAVKMPFSTF